MVLLYYIQFVDVYVQFKEEYIFVLQICFRKNIFLELDKKSIYKRKTSGMQHNVTYVKKMLFKQVWLKK